MSIYLKTCQEARSVATKLGHDLEHQWTVAESFARVRCTRCNASVVVRFWPPVEAFGGAVDVQCKDGNVAVEEPAPSQPPKDGMAKALPTFSRQRVPVLAR